MEKTNAAYAALASIPALKDRVFTARKKRINGNRVFLQTKGILDSVYDPNAYKFESTDPDEAFIEGAVSPFSSVLASVLARYLRDEEFSALEEQGIACGVAVQQICDHQILGAPSARAPK